MARTVDISAIESNDRNINLIFTLTDKDFSDSITLGSFYVNSNNICMILSDPAVPLNKRKKALSLMEEFGLREILGQSIKEANEVYPFYQMPHPDLFKSTQQFMRTHKISTKVNFVEVGKTRKRI